MAGLLDVKIKEERLPTSEILIKEEPEDEQFEENLNDRGLPIYVFSPETGHVELLTKQETAHNGMKPTVAENDEKCEVLSRPPCGRVVVGHRSNESADKDGKFGEKNFNEPSPSVAPSKLEVPPAAMVEDDNHLQIEDMDPADFKIEEVELELIKRTPYLGGKGLTMQTSMEISPRQHKRNQVRQLCKVCGYSTNDKSCLAAQMSVHIQEKPYVCDICNKSFKHEHHLQVHKGIHSGDKQFQCQNCRQRFSTKSSLKVHMITHKSLHSGDKQFQCDNCGKHFSRKAHVKRHLITHTDEKPFKCNTCGAEFNQKSTLNRHEKTHGQNAPVFPCNYCQYSSKRKDATKAHEIHKHTNKSSQLQLGFLTTGILK